MGSNMVKTFQTSSILHHVTIARNIKSIQKKGINAGAICSETGMGGCEYDDLEFMERDEMNIEERTRGAFNEILRDNKPKKEYPDHDNAVFFWSDDKSARYHRSAMDKKNLIGDYRIVQIYQPKIPCTCYEADFNKAEDLFQYIETNIEDIERIQNTGPETKEDKKIINEADALAKTYYKSMKPYRGVPKSDKEVVCPCDVSKKAIVRII